MTPLIFRLPICAEGSFKNSDFKDCAGNVGNVAIDEGLKGLFPNARVGNFRLSVKSRQSRRFAVFSLANYLSAVPPSSGMRWFAHSMLTWLDENEITPIVLSVGIQFSHFETDFLIHPERLEFIKQLSKRARFIGTRGHISNFVLARNGIRNTWAVGDPGVLWHEVLRPRESCPSSASEISTGFVLSGKNRSLCQRFALWELRHHGIRIVQSLEDGASRIDGTSRPQLRSAVLTWLLWPTNSSEMISSFSRHFEANAVVPCSLDDWKRSLAPAGLVITMRIHGLAIARSTGCAAVLIKHDLRTLELADFHSLPSIAAVDFGGSTSAQNLIMHSAAMEQESKNRAIECLNNVRHFLQTFEIDISSKLISHQLLRKNTKRRQSGMNSLLRAMSLTDSVRSHALATHVDLQERAPSISGINSTDRKDLLRRLGFETEFNL